MKVVIQCAGRKNPAATFTLHQRCLTFLAEPDPSLDQLSPWDKIPGLESNDWIDCIRDIGDPSAWEKYVTAGIGISGGGGLSTSGNLYANNIYRQLMARLGNSNVYILSAGWGLTRADRGIPDYNVTFATDQNTPKAARITPKARSEKSSIEMCIPDDDKIHLFLTPKYYEYWKLSFGAQGNHAERQVLHWRKGQGLPDKNIPSEQVQWHDCGKMRTNWQYKAARQFIEAISTREDDKQ